jgi:circadian clock protein KaiC
MSTTPTRCGTGIEGLDLILGGGLPRHRMYLVQGDPGVGKTTMSLQFLHEGVRQGERGLYIALSESAEEIDAVSASHCWSQEGVTIYQMSAGESSEPGEEENTLYVPSEVELGERMKGLLREVERVKPARIVLDSCTELRLLAQSQLRFRRQLLALKENLVKRKCTILLLDNPVTSGGDPLLQSLVHGVIYMEQLSPLYGAERRRLRVTKLREVRFRGGYHDLVIRRGGVQVFPRLVAAEHHEPYAREMLSSGLPEMDCLLGGGIERGSATLLMGPAGSTKSALASQYAAASAARGEKVAWFAFDESIATLLARSDGIGVPLRAAHEQGLVLLTQVDPAERSPGEFVHLVRRAVEEDGAKMIVVDSLNGYLHAMPEEQFLLLQLHELLSYLGQMGVATIMVIAQQGLVGQPQSPVDLSYLADNIVVFRYFEAGGILRRAVSVIKKRSGPHEKSIREVDLGPGGYTVGPPLEAFEGLLSGSPRLTGQRSKLLPDPA